MPKACWELSRPLIRALSESGCEVTLVASPGRELDEFEQTGRVRVRRVRMTRSISMLQDVRAILALVRIFRSCRFDLIHTHTPKAGLLGMVAARVAGVPRRIHTLHGLPLETSRGFRRRLLMAADRATCRLAHQVCVVSGSLRQRAADLRLCDLAKMIILGDGSACGVDLARFTRRSEVLEEARRIRRHNRIPADDIVLGFVGWLVADKGITELVDAFNSLSVKHEHLHLLMIGPEGGARDPLPPRTLEAIRHNPRIRYGGVVSDPVPYYAAMDLCVLPTRREGFPYALLEAGAMEVPVVATRVTGCVDAVLDGQTGLLVDLDSPAALAAAIERLAGDAALRHTMGATGRRRAKDLFGSDRLTDAHLELYRAAGLWCEHGKDRRISAVKTRLPE